MRACSDHDHRPPLSSREFYLTRDVPGAWFSVAFAGNFRYAHTRTRTYAESIAFYHGSEQEEALANRSLNELVRNQVRTVSCGHVFPSTVPYSLDCFVAILTCGHVLMARRAQGKLCLAGFGLGSLVQFSNGMGALVPYLVVLLYETIINSFHCIAPDEVGRRGEGRCAKEGG